MWVGNVCGELSFLSVYILHSLHMSCSHNDIIVTLSIVYFPSEDAMEYSKEFVTSVVLGKDLVPRYLFYYIQYTMVNLTLLQYHHNRHICCWSLIGSACHSWRVSDATFWKSYRKVTSQRWLNLWHWHCRRWFVLWKHQKVCYQLVENILCCLAIIWGNALLTIDKNINSNEWLNQNLIYNPSSITPLLCFPSFAVAT